MTCTMETNLELRRCGWLEKIANVGENRVPMKLLAAYVDTLRKLSFGSRSNDLSEWMPAARNPTLWAQIVEDRLGLHPGTYMKYK